MAETEAEGLLRNGALYPKRIGLRDPGGCMLFAGVKRGAFSLYFDDEPIYHFDLDGRWQRAYIDGNHVRKALDQSVDLIGRSRVPEGIALRRRPCSIGEIAGLDDSIRDLAIDVNVGLATGRFTVVGPPTPDAALGIEDLRDLLDRVSTWDAAAWFSMKERHRHVYRSHQTFIPPDAQNAIVLEPFEDDDRPRDPGEFASHCRDVARLLGRRAIQASTAFLAHRDLLRRPVAEILSDLDAVASVFPIRRDPRPTRPRDLPPDLPSLSGVDVLFEFWQGGGGLPDLPGWRALACAGVRRVTASFRHPGGRDDASASLADAKRAGVAVSVVLDFGAAEPGRIAVAANAVNALPLGRGDFVHMIAPSGDAGVTGAGSSGPWEGTTEMFAPALARGVRVTEYDLAKQWS